MAQQIPQNPPFLLDSLYCQEDNYSYFEDEQQQEESYHIDEITPNPPPKLLEQDLFWEDEELASLLSKQRANPLFNHTEKKNPSLIRARNDAVEWVLGVSAYFSFSALTSLLAVDYLDRFLFNLHFQEDKPWMTQLAAVACLSLAAKVEETEVPLLLDLQVDENRDVFEAKTIQRMEVLVLSSLQWRMNPVTPVSFLDHLIRRLGFKDYYICSEILRRCESLFLSIISDSKFMCYLPSVLATATMLHVVNGVDPSVAVDCQDQLLGTPGIDKDKVEDCYKLILESTSGFFSYQSNKRKFRLMPGSPSGVMDVCFSSDSSNDSWAVTASVSSSPEPLSKKFKAQDNHFQSLNHEASDILSFPL